MGYAWICSGRFVAGTKVESKMPKTRFTEKQELGAALDIAEYERDQISDRTRRALAQAKERGTKLGGPKRLEASALGAAASQRRTLRRDIIPIIREIQASGVTTLRGLPERSMHEASQSARGVPQSPVAVSNILKRSTMATQRR